MVLRLKDSVTEILEKLISLLGVGKVAFSKFERVLQETLKVHTLFIDLHNSKFNSFKVIQPVKPREIV